LLYIPILGVERELSGIEAVIIWENMIIARSVVTSKKSYLKHKEILSRF